jgi:hypothetical protein
MVLLVVLLGSANLVNPSFSQTNEETLEPTEILYAAVFFGRGIPILGDTLFVCKEVVFDFKNIQGLVPLNTSIQAFDEHFRDATYALFFDAEKCWMTLAVAYDSHVDINLAEKRTDEICQQFKSAFDLNLTVVYRSHDETLFYRRLGYFSYNVDNLVEIAKYRPIDGFGNLITRDYLNRYSNRDIGAIEMSYTLTRVDQTLFWRFYSLGTTSEIFGNRNCIDLDLNGILGHSGSIARSTQGQSKIIIDVEKVYETFTMSIERISPSNYDSMQESDTIDVIYFPNSSIDNIQARIKVSKIKNNSEWLAKVAVLVILVIFAIILTVVVLVKKRRKINEKNKFRQEN